MKEKNKKLIIVVAALILVIGVSFAYFTSSTIFGGQGSSVTGSTATLDNAEIKVEGSLSFNDLDIYPGHQNVSSIKVTATGENVLIPYHLIWEGTNTLNTSLNYTVYKTTSNIDVSASCTDKNSIIDGAKTYYEECSISNLDSLGSVVSSGTIAKGEAKKKIVSDEFITSSSEGEVVYYYVILEYPNLEENQNSDIGGSFNGEIKVELNDVSADIVIAKTYLEEAGEYKEVNDIPSEGYELNTSKSTCTNNATLGWDSDNNRIYVENLSQTGTECTLYYDVEKQLLKDAILANAKRGTGTPNFNKTSCTNRTNNGGNCGEQTVGLYEATTSKGTTYYFRGDVDDNYLVFADKYWRIIRINEDGSIRIIYSGEKSAVDNAGKETILANGYDDGNTDYTQIQTSAYNNSWNRSEYVGFRYTEGSQRPSNTNTGTESTIKGALDTWYSNNLQAYDSMIVSTPGFCNDREVANGSSWSSTGSNVYYKAYERLSTNKTPSFECSNINDLYQTKIGLITADEAAYAGGKETTNNYSYYLYTGNIYWTISPYYVGSMGDSYMFNIYTDGGLNINTLNSATIGVRPVINLSADTTIKSGNGTISSVYEI